MVAQRVLLSAVAGLAAAASNDTITSDTYFYGLSPPVYPSPDMTGEGEWAAAYGKARDLVSQMTLEEKINITTGIAPESGCSGVVPLIERLGFHGMCLSDNGNGLRATDFVSSFPSGVHAGASWNKHLTYQRGAAMGDEFKKKGVNVLLGPVVGPAWRTTLSGRNWEGFAADPYLSGVLAAQSIQGTQGAGVVTSVKHFIANEQETNRNPSSTVESLSSNIDDKTMHEFYLWPFQDAIKAGSGNVMCSYQRVNNSYGCANSKTMNGLLKTELGFQGFVVTDWDALHTGNAAVLAGLDMAMPNAGSFWGDELVKSVKNGSVPESRITDMATRILTPWYHFKQDEAFTKPGHGMPKALSNPHEPVDARDPDARPVLLNGAIEGHVLVKNTKNTLPLDKPKQLSVFGYSAKTPDMFSSPIAWMIGAQAIKLSEAVSGSLGQPGNFSAIGINGTLFGGCGSGATTPANMMSPLEALKARTYEDGTALSNDLSSDRPAVYSTSDACIVFANAWACEGYDRPALDDEYTDTLIKNVADSCNKTIVVFHNAGPRLVDGFIDHPNVSAVIFAHLPGQDSGPAIVSLLYGDSNPSGKLPYTVAKNASDYGAVLEPAQPEGKFTKFPQADFDEGVYVDYRRFDREEIEPRYEFGFGLSYTTFNMSNLDIVERIEGANTGEWPGGPIIPGGQADLWDVIASVSVDVANTGDTVGAEVAQLYLGIPDAPAKQLRGFEKVLLGPGEKKTAIMKLTRRDLSVWNVERQMWQLQRGEYKVYVGNSSRNLPLEGFINV